MLPPISHVLSVEMVRDGGSLAASYVNTDGSTQALFFPVNEERVDANHRRVAGWHPPEIQDRVSGLKIVVSWSHAEVFLGQLRSLIQDARQLGVLEAMREIARAGGAITPGALTVFPEIGTVQRVFRLMDSVASTDCDGDDDELAHSITLTPEQRLQLDRLLLSHASPRWQKMAMLVAAAMRSAPPALQEVPDRYFAQRLRRLVEQGVLEGRGDLSKMRSSEVPLPEGGGQVHTYLKCVGD